LIGKNKPVKINYFKFNNRLVVDSTEQLPLY